MAILFYLILIFSGCSLPCDYALEVVLPELPRPAHEFYPDIIFRPHFPKGSSRLFPADCSDGVRPGTTFEIRSCLPVLPVVAVPESGGREVLYRAGGIFPADSGDGRLYLTWENGFAAVMILDEVNDGNEMRDFNIGRFEETLNGKSGFNPWVFREEDISYALSYSVFNSSFIKKLPIRTVRIDLPFGPEQPEEWFLSNMSDKRVFTAENRGLVLDDIPERFVRVFSLSAGEEAEIFMDSSGWTAWFIRRKCVLSGSW